MLERGELLLVGSRWDHLVHKCLLRRDILMLRYEIVVWRVSLARSLHEDWATSSHLTRSGVSGLVGTRKVSRIREHFRISAAAFCVIEGSSDNFVVLLVLR